MTTLQIAIILKNEFYHYYFPNENGVKKSLLQIEETITELMRKSDKKLKPKPEKLKRPPTIKISEDEKKESKTILEKVKSKPHKIIVLPKGYSREWEKEKRAIQQRQQKKDKKYQ